jgi:hypothetical protein
VVDVKEPLQESAKFTLSLSLQLRLEQLEKMMGSSDSLANSNEVDSLRSGGGGWKRELGNEVEYDGVLAGAVKFTLQIELDHFYIAHGHADIFVPSICMSAGKLTPRRTISVAKECRSRCGFTRPVHPAARAVSVKLWRRISSQ